MRSAWPLIATHILLAVVASCGGDTDNSSRMSTSPAATTVHRTVAPTLTPTTSPSPSAQAETPLPTTHPGPHAQPLGFPIDPTTRLGRVSGEPGSRVVEWGTGLEALTYTRDLQPASDPEAANESGWNCAVHTEYEGRPAVDWYVPVGTPVFTTMSGTATLYTVTMANGFDWYGLTREPYLGNPDRQQASIRPFAGPSGGLGVYVEIDSDQFLTVSAHLDLTRTTAGLPVESFYPGYSPGTNYEALFASILATGGATPIAQWQVSRGDLIGYSGDAGYSEAPHLHYSIQRAGSDRLLCPTAEPGFEDGGWLLK